MTNETMIYYLHEDHRSVIIEKMFSIPGIGQLGYQAVLARDYPVVLALFATSSFLTLLGILLADLARDSNPNPNGFCSPIA